MTSKSAANDLSPKTERLVAYISGFVIIAALIGIAFFCPNPTAFQYTVFRITLAVGVGGFAAIIPGHFHIKWKGLIRAGSALGVFTLVYLYNPAQLVVPASEQRAQIKNEKHFSTLKDLFKNDFPNLLKVENKSIVKAIKSGQSVEVVNKVYSDDSAGTKFIAFLVPSSPETFGICSFLPAQVQPALDSLSKGIKVKSKNPGEPMIDHEAFPFSGRVFVYHEDYLSPKQIGQLTDQFEMQHFQVQFRGPDYQQVQLLRSNSYQPQ